jgi:hypothetical protein
MSDRPILEKLSWIATILALPVAIWFGWKSMTPPVESKVPEIQIAASSPTEATSDLAHSKTSKSESKNAKWSCDGDMTNLSVAFESTKAMPYPTSRDATFVVVGRKSLCIENYELFKKVIGEIAYPSNRDALIREGVDFAVEKKNFKVASELVDLMAYPSNSTEARQQIASKSLSGR